MCTQREVNKRASIEDLFKHRYLAEAGPLVQEKLAGHTGTGTGTGTGPDRVSIESGKEHEKTRAGITQDSIDRKPI
ncbi:hypothetical protein GCK32_021942 [Trichostrongylus colubriformis]|uniref:Uncharacterized protein n=1 Tax=Trichostrongylus colubriformis TaxID=6319 RepID=A0AAN8F3N5_TRICO